MKLVKLYPRTCKPINGYLAMDEHSATFHSDDHTTLLARLERPRVTGIHLTVIRLTGFELTGHDKTGAPKYMFQEWNVLYKD